jgi:L-aminopeptidase/D-esterase-like protein
MQHGPTTSLVDVPGLRVGHWTHATGGTGCTVVLCPAGATAGVDVGGGAPGTRETDLLRPECRVEQVHAILLAGGSAFGLAAADGVMRWLEERGVGYDVGIAHVPIVPAAVLFDLAVGRVDLRPDAASGYAACEAASDAPVAQGSVGAGMGATVGKGLGLGHASRGGLGTASLQTASGLIVAALAVVNAYGNVHDPASGRIVAGVRRLDAEGRCVDFVDAVELLAEGEQPEFARSNTTLGIVATNSALTKRDATKVAQMAHDGLARAIRPVHTGIDGDVVFALATGAVAANCDSVGALAADVLALAIVNGVRAASGGFGIPCAQELA